ncbi:glycosyl hydrolase [Grosmannia clavigera kw1407]|uniref:Glycosyl hydrolase n=1 Tax=Grosmannia clavigera (strain kw1407 / UAMH 11150) TaxID=655863 RepID=F0XHT2_GROCL|nr:glycosyl hydrolase [Grosmannia clavigera kw1407]EFX02646.1 glycosyl hydrolase [Grosmannia clavigera kw1407]
MEGSNSEKCRKSDAIILTFAWYKFNISRDGQSDTGYAQSGHVFPGAALPFGMAKAVADVNTELQGGFASDDGEITGFSHMHDSGTGGGARLGNFPIFAHTGCSGDVLNNCAFTATDRAVKRVPGSVVAEPGYFAVTLNTSVRAEMTVTNHTALYRFTFPSDRANLPYSYSPLVLFDLKDLSDSRINGSVAVDAQTGHITSNGTFGPSFGVGSYDLHFCVDFHGADVRDSGVFANNRAGNTTQSLRTFANGVDVPPVPAGAWVQFAPPAADDQILVRVGLSLVSVGQACTNAESELTGPDFDFDGTRTAAADAWRAKLAVVQIDDSGVDNNLSTVFWSGLYRAMISPQDYTGENPLWHSNEPYYDSFYCIWDSFRSIHSLLTLVDPQSQTLMVRSLIDIYRHEGWLPDCRMSLCKGLTQGGSNADVVLADAYLKGLTDGIDWDTGYEAVVKDAEVEPPIWNVEGRGGLASWKQCGWSGHVLAQHQPDGRVCVRRLLHRSDGGGHGKAGRCGKVPTASWPMGEPVPRRAAVVLPTGGGNESAKNSENSESAETTDSGFAGFLQPRFLNGTFGFQDPALCQPLLNFTSCYLTTSGHEMYEGGSWLYTLYAPHDMAALIGRLGGPDAFVARLQYIHDTPGLLYMGDEQAFLLVFVFHYAGRPALSARYAHTYIPAQFNTTTVGIPGNDDSGAMGAFSSLTMLGLWPVAGQDVYLITPPFFREVSVTSRLTGRIATVRCRNFDPAPANIYIQNATLNGRPYSRNWLSHRFFSDGGLLELTLGPSESAWGTAEADLPPSMSTE